MYKVVLAALVSFFTLSVFAQDTLTGVFLAEFNYPSTFYHYRPDSNVTTVIDYLYSPPVNIVSNEGSLFSGGGGAGVYKHDAATLQRMDSLFVPNLDLKVEVNEDYLIVLTGFSPFVEVYNKHTLEMDSDFSFSDTLPAAPYDMISYENKVYISSSESGISHLYMLDLTTKTLVKGDSIGVEVTDLFVSGTKLLGMQSNYPVSDLSVYDLTTERFDTVYSLTTYFEGFNANEQAALNGNNLYFISAANSRIYHFDLTTYSVTDTNLTGHQHHGMMTMAYEKTREELYISDYTTAQIFRYTTNGTLIDSFATTTPVYAIEFAYKTAEVTSSAPGFKNLRVNIFPNPAISSGPIIIRGLDNQNYEFMLYNIQGQLLFEQSVISANSVVHLPALPAGIYLYQLYREDGETYSDRLVVTEE